MRKGYDEMEKRIYHTPYVSVIINEQEDVICASGDTDVPFIEKVSVSEV